jgi:hypothetical protein
MPPLVARRRSRRRSWPGRAVVLVCILVVLGLLIGGLAHVGARSGPFHTSEDASFAAQAAVVADESNATAVTVQRLMGTMQQRDRAGLEAMLDTVVAQTAQQASAASAFVSPAASGGVGLALAQVFADRADAVRDLRAALDGLLGMEPLALPGTTATGTAAGSTQTPPALSATQATTRIAAAGKLVAQSDQRYATARRQLAQASGHERLPASRWIHGPNQWSSAQVATDIVAVAGSATLAATHRLVLRAVTLSPPALPPASGVANPALSVVAPTHRLTVSIVVSNLGSVNEHRATVRCTLTPQPTGVAKVISRGSPLVAGASIALPTVSYAVHSGHQYQLTVAIVLPAGQSDAGGTSLTQMISIAPGT